MVHEFGLELVYDRLEEGSNGRRVVFKEADRTRKIPQDWTDEVKSAYKRKKYRGCKEKFKHYLGTGEFGDAVGGGRFDSTCHVICLYGQSNDTALPDLKLNLKKQEISFGWEGMLSSFLSEAHDFSNRQSGGNDSFMDAISSKQGEWDPEEAIQLMIDSSNKTSQTKKKLRRERILKHYLAIDNTWKTLKFPFDDEEEEEILERISCFVGRGGDEQHSLIGKALGNPALSLEPEDTESDVGETVEPDDVESGEASEAEDEDQDEDR